VRDTKKICVNLCSSVAEFFAEIPALAKVLTALGCQPKKSARMAAQLEEASSQNPEFRICRARTELFFWLLASGF
jgi:hypothetical protein